MRRASRSFNNQQSFAVVFLVFLLIAAGCDGATRVTGNIIDEDGKPLADAVIVLEVDGRKDETEAARRDFTRSA